MKLLLLLSLLAVVLQLAIATPTGYTRLQSSYLPAAITDNDTPSHTPAISENDTPFVPAEILFNPCTSTLVVNRYKTETVNKYETIVSTQYGTTRNFVKNLQTKHAIRTTEVIAHASVTQDITVTVQDLLTETKVTTVQVQPPAVYRTTNKLVTFTLTNTNVVTDRTTSNVFDINTGVHHEVATAYITSTKVQRVTQHVSVTPEAVFDTRVITQTIVMTEEVKAQPIIVPVVEYSTVSVPSVNLVTQAPVFITNTEILPQITSVATKQVSLLFSTTYIANQVTSATQVTTTVHRTKINTKTLYETETIVHKEIQIDTSTVLVPFTTEIWSTTTEVVGAPKIVNSDIHNTVWISTRVSHDVVLTTTSVSFHRAFATRVLRAPAVTVFQTQTIRQNCAVTSRPQGYNYNPPAKPWSFY